MCIIIFKAPGLEMPKSEIIDNCFSNNDDGAGFAIRRPGADHVHIKKGFMTLEAYQDALSDEKITKNDVVGLHFRISTAGGVKPGLTHPFPISASEDDLMALDIKCKRAFIHNGIIKVNIPKDSPMNDTQVFVKDFLSALKRPKKHVERIAQRTMNSRTLFIEHNGLVYSTGEWQKDDETGLFFSNGTWKYKRAKYVKPAASTGVYYGNYYGNYYGKGYTKYTDQYSYYKNSKYTHSTYKKDDDYISRFNGIAFKNGVPYCDVCKSVMTKWNDEAFYYCEGCEDSVCACSICARTHDAIDMLAIETDDKTIFLCPSCETALSTRNNDLQKKENKTVSFIEHKLAKQEELLCQ